MRTHAAQLAKFSLVGSSGYVINIAVYATLLQLAGMNRLPAASCSFLAAAASNYTWNRLWTFRARRGSVARQGLRFLAVSVAVGGAGLLMLTALTALGLRAVEAQALAVMIVMPLSFTANRAWSFRGRPRPLDD
ncbi:putative membrane protein [Gaiella occulta]|uniref:Putative membrane protein n=1 Tax=Gaiella occulta TaxID=1002870 RepID=A0A7M2Z0J1_9ACTN|nr:GtrA family protein [Gaiella occulta]RDI75936.1 putative membrane protein [Gaiella occulta]